MADQVKDLRCTFGPRLGHIRIDKGASDTPFRRGLWGQTGVWAPNSRFTLRGPVGWAFPWVDQTLRLGRRPRPAREE